MSKEPVSTIIRSDAPRLVEVKPGSLNASTTKSWVEAGEVNPEDLIQVVEMPQQTHNRQAVHAGGVDPNLQSVAASGIASNHQAVVEPGLANANHQPVVEGHAAKDNRQPVVETDEAKANRQKLSDEAVASARAGLPDQAIQDQRAALPPTEPLGTHHEPVPDAGALNDHHEPVEQDRIRDHQEPVQQGQMKDNHQPLDSSATRDHFDPVHASGGLADGPKIPHAPGSEHGPSAVSEATVHTGEIHADQPGKARGVGTSSSSSAKPGAAARKADNPAASIHLTHDPEAFKSRVAAIRESVSHITDHLDHIENKH